MSLCFSCRCAGSLGNIAVLLTCDQDFTLAVLRAVRHHMSESVSAIYFCGVDRCMHHPEHWTQSDIEEGNRQRSEAEFSGFTELNGHPPSDTVTKEDEDAMQAAEVLEALSEVHDSGWCPVNKTVSWAVALKFVTMYPSFFYLYDFLNVGSVSQGHGVFWSVTSIQNRMRAQKSVHLAEFSGLWSKFSRSNYFLSLGWKTRATLSVSRRHLLWNEREPQILNGNLSIDPESRPHLPWEFVFEWKFMDKPGTSVEETAEYHSRMPRKNLSLSPLSTQYFLHMTLNFFSKRRPWSAYFDPCSSGGAKSRIWSWRRKSRAALGVGSCSSQDAWSCGNIK